MQDWFYGEVDCFSLLQADQCGWLWDNQWSESLQLVGTSGWLVCHKRLTWTISWKTILWPLKAASEDRTRSVTIPVDSVTFSSFAEWTDRQTEWTLLRSITATLRTRPPQVEDHLPDITGCSRAGNGDTSEIRLRNENPYISSCGRPFHVRAFAAVTEQVPQSPESGRMMSSDSRVDICDGCLNI